MTFLPHHQKREKLTGTCGDGEPPPKKRKQSAPSKKRKRAGTSSGGGPPPKKPCETKGKKSGMAAPCQNRVWPFKFHAVDEEWQRNACQSMGLTFERANGVCPGSSDTPLTRPDMRRNKKIQGDGNCMFRYLSLVLTGSQSHHGAIRAKVVRHMRDNIPTQIMEYIKGRHGYDKCKSVDEYVQKSKMDQDGSWGSGVELACFAHLSKTCLFSYVVDRNIWDRLGPHNVERNVSDDVSAKSVYLCLSDRHYTLVGSTVKAPNSADSNKGDPKSSDPKESGQKSSDPKESCQKSTDPKKNNRAPSNPMLNADVWEDYRFHSVDQQWQTDKCSLLGLPFLCQNGVDRGGPNVLLTRPRTTRTIRGDGNCLFRCFSYIITGSERYHTAVRRAMIAHMPNMPDTFVSSTVHTVDQYIRNTGMDKSGTWGTDKEVVALAHLLNTRVFAYAPASNYWTYLAPEHVDPSLYTPRSEQSIYIVNAELHFTVVMSTRQISSLDAVVVV